MLLNTCSNKTNEYNIPLGVMTTITFKIFQYVSQPANKLKSMFSALSVNNAKMKRFYMIRQREKDV
jgi:hypothetical protein